MSVYKTLEVTEVLSDLTKIRRIIAVLQTAFPMLANVITGVRGSMEAGFTATQTLKIGLSGLWEVMKAHPVMATIAAIGTLITVINNLKQASAEEAAKEAEKTQNIVTNNKETLSSLDELVKKYKELAKADRTDSSNREAIREVQNEIVSLVGDQASNLDLVNGKLEEQLRLINSIYGTETSNSTSSYRRAADAASDKVKTIQFNEFDNTPVVGGIYHWLRNLGTDGSKQILIKDAFGELASNDIVRKIETTLKEAGLDANLSGSGLDFVFNLPENFSDRIEALDLAIKTLEGFDGYEDNKLWEKLNDIRGEVYTALNDTTSAYDDLLQNLLNTEHYSTSGQDKISNISSIDDLIVYRQELINKLNNDDDIKRAIELGLLSSNYVEQQVNGFLGGLDECSYQYNEWYNQFGSDVAKSVNDLKDKLQLDVYFSEPENFFNGKNYAIEEWFNNLTDKQKDIIVKIRTEVETDDWTFEEWQEAVKNYKVPEEDKFHFSDLIATDSFQNSIKDYEDKITKLADALKNLRKGELSESDKVELFENFPELASQADNLDEAIVSLLNNLDSDVVEDFNNKLNYMETDDDVTALNNLKDSILNLSSSARQISNVTSEITLLRDSLSNLKDTYNSVTGIIDDYNKNGYYSLENLQSLLKLEPEYINALIDENGQINLNSQAYKIILMNKQKTNELPRLKKNKRNMRK